MAEPTEPAVTVGPIFDSFDTEDEVDAVMGMAAWLRADGLSEHGYGRYKDDPTHVGCPRAKTDMTPCIARDGHLALADDGRCVGCYWAPADLLAELTDLADLLKVLVWTATESE